MALSGTDCGVAAPVAEEAPAVAPPAAEAAVAPLVAALEEEPCAAAAAPAAAAADDAATRCLAVTVAPWPAAAAPGAEEGAVPRGAAAFADVVEGGRASSVAEAT